MSFSLFSISAFLRGGRGTALRYQYAARCCEAFHAAPTSFPAKSHQRSPSLNRS